MKAFVKSILVKLLTLEAKALLWRHRPYIIAITGNVGKTSTKDAIYTALKSDIYIRKSQKSYNSEIGVPLSVLGLDNAWNNPWLWLRNIFDGALQVCFLRSYPDVLVLEAGVDRPGDMAQLATWLKPDMVVLTRFPDVPVHIEYFANPEAVVAEKMELVYALRPDGVVVYNHDDETIVQALKNVRHKQIGFGRYAPTDFTAQNDETTYEHGRPVGVSYTVTHGEESCQCMIRGTLGTHMLYTYTAALATAYQYGMKLGDIATNLEAHTPPPGRMRILAGIQDSVILDDTYNASPLATEYALRSLYSLKTERKIAVIGDMLELGQYSVEEHKKIGILAGEVDMLIALGVRSRTIAKYAMQHGLSEKHVLQYDDVIRAAEELAPKIKPGDVVLVKASQGIRAERLVKRLLANPDDAKSSLVRQSDAWLQR